MSFWRISLVAAIAAGVLTLVVWMVVALWRLAENGESLETELEPTRQAPVLDASGKGAGRPAPAPRKATGRLHTGGPVRAGQLYVD